MSDDNAELKDSPFGLSNGLYRTDLKPSENFARLYTRRGLNLGGLKAVAAEAFRLIDQYEVLIAASKGKDMLALLKGKGGAIKMALEACQEKRDITRDRKNKYAKPAEKKKPPTLIEAREKMAARNREKEAK